MKSFSFAIVAVLLLGMLSLSGCGYTFAGRKGLLVESVRIGPIKNKSMEPGLSQVLISALSDELMKQGINVDQNSRNMIYGNLTQFTLSGVSEANQSFTAYQVTIAGRFIFRGADGKEVVLPGSTPFIITFSSQGALNEVFAQRQLAVQSGMQNLASQIVSGLLVPLK